MNDFEKKPWNVNDPYCETCRGFLFIEREGYARRFPCRCQAIHIPFDSITLDEEFDIRAGEDVGFEMLVASIKKEGLLNPLIVARDGEGYKVIDGFRRYRAILELLTRESVSRSWPSSFASVPVFIFAINTKEVMARRKLEENSSKDKFEPVGLEVVTLPSDPISFTGHRRGQIGEGEFLRVSSTPYKITVTALIRNVDVKAEGMETVHVRKGSIAVFVYNRETKNWNREENTQ